MSEDGKRRVFVVPSVGGSPSEIELYKLLSKAEIDLSTIVFLHTVEDMPVIAAKDAVVFVLRDDTPSDPVADAATLAAARAGSCHIVGIWAPDQAEKGIHPAALKYATAQRPWDADKLRNELGSDCSHAFETADGDEAEPNGIEPNECE